MFLRNSVHKKMGLLSREDLVMINMNHEAQTHTGHDKDTDTKKPIII
jgi:hypothetical protein